MAIHNPLTSYEPNQLDNFDYSQTSAAIFQDESVDIDTELSYSCDAEVDDELIVSATPMLQNLRIGLKKRRKGKSDTPVRPRGKWRCILKLKEKHKNNILLTFGELVSTFAVNN